VVGTYRDVEITNELSHLLADLAARSSVVPLTGLGRDDVASLLAEVTDQGTEADVAALVHRRTGGNPFFVQEIARLLVAQGTHAHVSTAGYGIPEGVRDAIQRSAGAW